MPKVPGRMLAARFVVGILGAVLVGCAHGGRPADDASSLVITRAQVEASGEGDALAVVRHLRPEFLTYRGPTTVHGEAPAMPVVYVDGMPFGTIQSLAGIPAEEVEEIRLLRSWDAVTRYGRDKEGGVILVTTRH